MQEIAPGQGMTLVFSNTQFCLVFPFPGILRDHLGTYDVAFYLAGVPPLIGGAVLCFIPWLHAKKKPKELASPIDWKTTEKMLETENTSPLDSVEKSIKGTESVI